MGTAAFETVAEAQRRARRRLPRPVYMALVAGSEAGRTMRENVDAFSELAFAPRIASSPARRTMATTVMGQDLALPVIASPTAVQAVHPEGEVALARATAAVGTAMGLSSFASKPIEQVLAANPRTLFQLYWAGTREMIAERVARARAAGAVGLIVTLDWSFAQARDWRSPIVPERLDLRTLAQLAPSVLTRPAYLLDWARAGGPPDLMVPNMAAGGEVPSFVGAYGQWLATPPPTWDDVRWLRGQWDGPLMVKGVMSAQDALRAADAGADAVSVSNHGGNNLDGTPASIRALPAVVDAVGDRLEVLMDGGIRRGGDVVAALALGARAVMIGRAYLWGLGAAGQAGVENVFEILRGGIDSALLGLGLSSTAELTREHVIVPDGFAHGLDGTRAA